MSDPAILLVVALGGVAFCCALSSGACGLAYTQGWFGPDPAPAWVCPPDHVWGWGANAGKCCKGDKCVGPIIRSGDDGGTSSPSPQWKCPPDHVWGWGANAGKCCKGDKCYAAIKS